MPDLPPRRFAKSPGIPDSDSHQDPHRSAVTAGREHPQQHIARPRSAISGNDRNTAYLCAVAGMARQHH